jgi:hypothetical protein
LKGYELAIEAGALVALLEDADGVIDDESIARIDAFIDASGDKLAAYAAVVRRLNAEADTLAAEKKRIAARFDSRIKGLRSQRERLRGCALELLTAHRELTGERSIKGETFSAHLSKTSSLVVPDDPLEWPAAFVSSVPKLNRSALTKALRGGESFDGCDIREGWTVVLK